MHEITAKEFKRKNAPSIRDVDLTYVKSSSETASASSEYEGTTVTSIMERKQVHETFAQYTLPIEFNSSHLKPLKDNRKNVI